MRKVDPLKHEQKRHEILAAAEFCFGRKGFQGASIAEICSAAGISPGHLYHYFASKEAIVEELAELRLSAALESMEAILSGPDPLTAFLDRFCQPPAANTDAPNTLMLELLAEAERNPAIGTMMRSQAARARTMVCNLIRHGQADRRIDPTLDPQLTASILIAVVIDGLKALTVREPDLARDQVSATVRLLVQRFLTGHVAP
jgi:AcrR family transcriptional regulator